MLLPYSRLLKPDKESLLVLLFSYCTICQKACGFCLQIIIWIYSFVSNWAASTIGQIIIITLLEYSKHCLPGLTFYVIAFLWFILHIAAQWSIKHKPNYVSPLPKICKKFSITVETKSKLLLQSKGDCINWCLPTSLIS